MRCALTLAILALLIAPCSGQEASTNRSSFDPPKIGSGPPTKPKPSPREERTQEKAYQDALGRTTSMQGTFDPWLGMRNSDAASSDKQKASVRSSRP